MLNLELMIGASLYGLTLAVAVFFPTWLLEILTRRVKNFKPVGLAVWDALIWALIPALAGARLYHVVDFWAFYSLNPYLIPQFWTGGIGIIGGIIGGAFGLYLYSGFKKIPFLAISDIGVLGLSLGQAIGRWGNYFNNELLPFALYESAWNFGMFLVLLLLILQGETLQTLQGLTLRSSLRRGLPRGGLTAAYLLLYGLGRFFLEGFREFSWQVRGIPVAQVFSLTFVLVSLILFLYASKKKVPH